MNDPMYVGLQQFPSYKKAAEYCDLLNLSYTLIDERPLRLPRKHQLAVDLEATSDKHWSLGPSDD